MSAEMLVPLYYIIIIIIFIWPTDTLTLQLSPANTLTEFVANFVGALNVVRSPFQVFRPPGIRVDTNFIFILFCEKNKDEITCRCTGTCCHSGI